MSVIEVPLPKGFSGLSAYPRLKERLVNLFNIEGRVLDTPGIAKVVDGFGPSRASFVFKDQLYMVMGTKLQRVDETGALLEVGDIPGDRDLDVALSFTQVALVGAGDGVDGYTFDGTTVEQIDSAQYTNGSTTQTGAVSVAYQDGHFIFCPDDGGPIFFSDVNDPGSIPANQFFDAEVTPDRNLAVIVIRQTLYVLGVNSIELFRNRAALPAPFVRVDGGSIPVGYLSALIEWSDTFAFIGRDKDQAHRIYVAGRGEAQAISNEAVNELINTEYTESELLEGTSERLQWLSKDILVFNLPRHSLGFHKGEWFFVRSGIVGPTGSAAWRARHIRHWQGKYWCGDNVDGRIGHLVEADTEYGNPIQRFMETFIRESERELHFTINSLDVDAIATTAGEGRIGLSVSDDGVLYGPTMWTDCPSTYGQRINFEYPGGLGDYESHAGVRLFATDNARFASDSLTVDVS